MWDCRRLLHIVAFTSLGLSTLAGAAQQQRHGRGYKPPPPTAEVTVTVQKGFNQKPLANASVIFHAERDGKLTGNLETKTDPEGRASLDLLEIGSHVTVQVIAGGFATYATDFDLTDAGKQVLVQLQRPRAQVSQYSDNEDRPAEVRPGVQERPKPAPQAQPVSPTQPLSTTPPANTPATTHNQPGSPK